MAYASQIKLRKKYIQYLFGECDRLGNYIITLQITYIGNIFQKSL